MKKKSKAIQISLISIGFFLFLATYVFYPQISNNKTVKNKQSVIADLPINIAEEEINTFENIEYKGIHGIDTPFVVQSTKAHILKEDTDVVFMDNMKVTMNMSDGRIVVITSDKGKYNKTTYDCFFEENVKATDGKITMVSKNLDLLASEDAASVYNNVILTNDKSLLIADKVDYNFEAKKYRISMLNSYEKVKVKIIE
jgi:lipopolysaccharide export system protein LptA